MQKPKCSHPSGDRSKDKAPGLPWLAFLDNPRNLHFWLDSYYSRRNQHENKNRHPYRVRLPMLRTPLENLIKPKIGLPSTAGRFFNHRFQKDI